MCNDPLKLLLAEAILFVTGAMSLWYSFRIEAELAFGKRLYSWLGIGFIWNIAEAMIAPGNPKLRIRIYRAFAYFTTAFFWGLCVFFIVAMPRCR
jgi:hypothetical protein